MEEFWFDHYIKVMPDYCSCGVWNSEGVGSDTHDLPISEKLSERLANWCILHDKYGEPGNPKEQYTKGQIKELGEIGFEIAKDMKKELPDWTIVYWDIRRLYNKPRLDVEYEILSSS